jgi:uncharacterized membrane protein
MTFAPGRAARRAAIAAGVVGYPLLAHYSAATSAAAASPSLGIAAALTPPLTILLWLGWHSQRRVVALALWGALGALLWAFRGVLEHNLTWVYFIQHAGTNVMLAAAFGQTLARGRQPLCTRMAEAVRGSLCPEVVRYTRQITLAWTLFFLAIALASTVLFLWARIGVWSEFANLLWIPLILLMFAAEYQVRLRRLPQLEHRGIMDGIRAFRRTSPVSPGTSPSAR